MSLLQYESLLTRLNLNKANGNVSPHKVALMLAVMDLIEAGIIPQNQIDYSDTLIAAFSKRFDALKGSGDRDNPYLPYFHLRSEGFWHHKIKAGQTDSYRQLTTASGSSVIQKHIAYAYLDDELFELLRNHIVRELLRSALFSNLDITKERRQQLLEVDGWDWLECEACVAEYFDMLAKELRGEKYNKTAHRKLLSERLNNRSEGSIEFKHQNVSAVLIEMGFPYISGYKPRFNYQSQLGEVVLAYLAANQDALHNFSFTKEVPERFTTNWDDVLDTEIPERIPAIVVPDRQFIARHTNFTYLEANNRILGQSGEEFVMEYERAQLRKAGREDLANEIEWSSRDRGDGLGFDVRSFTCVEGVARDEEHFIEVKTTNSGKYQPFYVTENELAFSEISTQKYSLYRVYNFKEKRRLFQMQGSIKKFVTLKTALYKASFTALPNNAASSD